MTPAAAKSSTRRLRAIAVRTKKVAKALLAKLMITARSLPEYSALDGLSGANTFRAARLAELIGAAHELGDRAEALLAYADRIGLVSTPKQSNPSKPKPKTRRKPTPAPRKKRAGKAKRRR